MAKPRLVKVRALFYVLQQVMKRGCIGILIHPLFCMYASPFLYVCFSAVGPGLTRQAGRLLRGYGQFDPQAARYQSPQAYEYGVTPVYDRHFLAAFYRLDGFCGHVVGL